MYTLFFQLGGVMAEKGMLLKLVTDSEAIIYKIIETDTTAYKTVEVCRIGHGKMLISYKNKKEFYIYCSDIGTTYKKVSHDELNKIIEILSDSLKEIGY